MGKEDTAARKYLSDPARFADLFNHEVYEGEAVIDPASLRATDTSEASSDAEGRRDLLKEWVRKSDDDTIYAILGLEEQTHGHPAMPVRCALYDAMAYGEQVRTLARKNKHRGMVGASAAEFLSGLWEADRLRPVVTIVLYLGTDDWTWPETLRGTIDADVDRRLMAFVPDYRMNLVVPARMSKEELDSFSTELGLALNYIKYSANKEDLTTMVQRDERYRSVDAETASFLNTITHSGLALGTEEGGVDMCKAIDDMRREERMIGEETGERKNLLGNLRSLVAHTGWELAKAFDALDVPEGERASLAAELGAAT